MSASDSSLDVVAAIVVDHQNRVLACRRAPGRSAAGQWEFPGGKIEPGESAEQALVREIREELGADLVDLQPFASDDTAVSGTTIRLICFRGRFRGSRPTSSTDHDLLSWLRRDELDAVEWALPDLPAVARLREDGL